jgi:cystathionine beta-lyase/cystathionine gamma-synthase
MRPASRAVHAGHRPRAREPLAPAIEQAAVYVYEELEDYDAVARGDRPGHVYARNSNATVAAFQAAVAELEGAEAGVATASGMAAILVAVRALAPAPGRILAPPDLYGGTWLLFRRELEPLGYRLEIVDVDDTAALAARLDDASLLVLETISNPRVRVVDIAAISAAAGRAGVPVLVDNTFASPILCRPLELGATAVVHSATKYIGGHSDLVAGVAVGTAAFATAAAASGARLGTTLGPFEAWLGLRGLRTLELRMRRHSENALALAEFLREAPHVAGVDYPTLPGSAREELARRLLPEGAGGMLCFHLDGGRPAVQRFLDGLRMVTFAASLGGVETTISHPEVTSHRYLSDEERAALGIGPGTVRVSAGIEAAEDIVDDFRSALGAG